MWSIYVFFNALNSNFSESEYHNLLLFGESLATLFIWNFFFILWLDFYLDAWIVTNERIINIEQRGFFTRKISELKLTKIQDVTSEIIGVIPTLFNYGNIYVQTAGEKERFIFYQIPNPNYVKNVIVELQEKERLSEEKELGEIIRGKNKSDFSGMIYKHPYFKLDTESKKVFDENNKELALTGNAYRLLVFLCGKNNATLTDINDYFDPAGAKDYTENHVRQYRYKINSIIGHSVVAYKNNIYSINGAISKYESDAGFGANRSKNTGI